MCLSTSFPFLSRGPVTRKSLLRNPGIAGEKWVLPAQTAQLRQSLPTFVFHLLRGKGSCFQPPLKERSLQLPPKPNPLQCCPEEGRLPWQVPPSTLNPNSSLSHSAGLPDSFFRQADPPPVLSHVWVWAEFYILHVPFFLIEAVKVRAPPKVLSAHVWMHRLVDTSWVSWCHV